MSEIFIMKIPELSFLHIPFMWYFQTNLLSMTKPKNLTEPTSSIILSHNTTLGLDFAFIWQIKMHKIYFARVLNYFPWYTDLYSWFVWRPSVLRFQQYFPIWWWLCHLHTELNHMNTKGSKQVLELIPGDSILWLYHFYSLSATFTCYVLSDRCVFIQNKGVLLLQYTPAYSALIKNLPIQKPCRDKGKYW